MEEEVCILLKAWDLEKYTEAFKENHLISMSLVQLLSATEIKELFPSIGHRVLFTQNLEGWRNAMQPNASTSLIQISRTLSVRNSPDLNKCLSFSSSEVPSDAQENSCIAVSDKAITDNRKVSNENEENLQKLLENSQVDKRIITVDKTRPLSKIMRLHLVRIICTHILKINPERNITTQTYVKWTNEIVNMFPCENRSVYFYNKVVGSSRGSITRLAGKLPDYIHNLKRKYRQMGIITKRQCSLASSPSSSRASSPSPQPMRHSTTTCDFSEIEDTDMSEKNSACLRNSSHRSDTTEGKCEKTTRARLLLSKDMSISQYFDENPDLKKVFGYKLLVKDFNTLYSNNYKGLTENFPNFKQELYKLARSKRTNVIRRDTFLSDLLSLENCSEDISDIGAFLLIPTLLTTTNVNVRLKDATTITWRQSKSESRAGFITHVLSDAEIEEAIECRRKNLEEFDLTLQPFILIVGSSLKNISSYLIIVNDTKYILPTILEAVDVCFKIIFLINAEYPIESKCTWMFIQKAFFKIRTDCDKESTAANTLLAELGIK